MKARDTFHDYATQIELICDQFARAHARGASQSELVRITKPAAELLHTLGIGVRGDQDYGRTDRPNTRVGSLLSGATACSPSAFRVSYQPPFSGISGSTPLDVRDAFNKILHADGSDASYYVDANHYEVIVSGKAQGGPNAKPWLAVISLPALMSAVKSLPDHHI